MKAVSDPLPMPQHLAPDIGDEVQKVILKGTAKQTTDRFDSIASLRNALQAAAERDAGSVSRRTTIIQGPIAVDAARKASRAPMVAAAAVAGAAIAAGGIWWATNGTRTQSQVTANPMIVESSDTTAAPQNAPAPASMQPPTQADKPPSDSIASATTAAAVNSVRDSGRTAAPPLTAAPVPQAERKIAAAVAPRREREPPANVASAEQDARMAQVSKEQTNPQGSDTPASAAGPVAKSQASLDRVHKGETTQADLIRLFGGPNLTTYDEAGLETWIYERTQTQTDVTTSGRSSQANARLDVFFGSADAGAAADAARSSQTTSVRQAVRSITVIVKFARDRTVYDYTVRETYF
jgi:hypothetical protein